MPSLHNAQEKKEESILLSLVDMGTTHYGAVILEGLKLGLLCIELLAGLRKGKVRSVIFPSKSLDRKFRIETNTDPYGLQIYPIDN